GGDRADPRFGVARPRRAEAHLLSVDPVRPYRAPRERQRAISKERAAQGLAGGLMSRLARFVLAGGIGFVADAAVLWLLLSVTPLGPAAGRVLSIGFALAVTWQFNRHLTFAPSSRGSARESARDGGVGTATGSCKPLPHGAWSATPSPRGSD